MPNNTNLFLRWIDFLAYKLHSFVTQVDPDFAISCLEEVWVTVRSPLNAEQKMNTLESFIKYAKNLKALVINILRMKSSHSSADDFFDDICKFRYCNPKIVRIE